MLQLPSKLTDPAYEKLVKLREEAPESVWQPVWRLMAQADLYFLFRYVLSTKDRKHADHPWIFERIREVQAEPNSCLDIWSREHYKSTIITFCLSVFDIINDPEVTIGIFSHTRDNSKDSLRVIKEEFENNQLLKDLFPDIFFADPAKESPLWTINDGIVVKRKSNKKESTVEAWGLDNLPVGKHFTHRVYDDPISKERVSTDEQIKKYNEYFYNSVHLGSEGGVSRVVGTRYAIYDLYGELIDRGRYKLRRYVYHDGAGASVLFSQEYLDEKRADTSSEDWAAQMECDPLTGRVDGFDVEWLRTYTNSPVTEARDKNLYILVDPAHSRKERDKKAGDYTVMAVVGLGPDANYYLIDLIRDRLNLTDRTDKLFDLVKTWRPILVGYERYGAQSDIQHIQETQERYRHRFEIVELAGRIKKEERIKRLVPVMEKGRFYIPEDLYYLDVSREKRNLIKEFKEEEMAHFPLAKHDDMLDCISRILDPDFPALFPNAADLMRAAQIKGEDKYERAFREQSERAASPNLGWMAN